MRKLVFVCLLLVIACGSEKHKSFTDFITAEEFFSEFGSASNEKLLRELPEVSSRSEKYWTGMVLSESNIPKRASTCKNDIHSFMVKIPNFTAKRQCVQDEFWTATNLYVPVYEQDKGFNSVPHPILESGYKYDDTWQRTHVAYNEALIGIFSWAEYVCEGKKREKILFFDHYSNSPDNSAMLCLPEAENNCHWELTVCSFPTATYVAAMDKLHGR